MQCIYCNVCKALDENFKRVVCYLWPKGSLQAPLPSEAADRPRWPSGGQLRASEYKGSIKLEWERAEHSQPVTGYDIFRSCDKVSFTRVKAVPRLYYRDTQVVGGRTYFYYVQAYDAAGKHSFSTDLVECQIPTAVPLKMA